MAVPFRRTSKTKKRMRRTHLKKNVGSLAACPNCGATIRPHRMCTECGFYKGREVVSKEVKEEVEPVKETKTTKKESKPKKEVKVTKKTTKKEEK